jgi:hypothetical protein
MEIDTDRDRDEDGHGRDSDMDIGATENILGMNQGSIWS